MLSLILILEKNPTWSELCHGWCQRCCQNQLLMVKTYSLIQGFLLNAKIMIFTVVFVFFWNFHVSFKLLLRLTVAYVSAYVFPHWFDIVFKRMQIGAWIQFVFNYFFFLLCPHRNHGNTTTQLCLGTNMLNMLYVFDWGTVFWLMKEKWFKIIDKGTS